MAHRVAIVWLRNALRLADNPALMAALDAADAVVPVYLREPAADRWAPGAASQRWLAHSLGALNATLCERGSALVVRSGAAGATLRALAAECGATAVYADRRFEPGAARADAAVALSLDAAGIEFRALNCALLSEPHEMTTASGGPYKVFTPYYKACLREHHPAAPLPAPQAVPAPAAMPKSDPLPAAPGPMDSRWVPGEAGALAKAERFVAEAMTDYPEERDRPDVYGTSRISPHLAFGEIGPRQLVAMTRDAGGATAEPFIRELYWREFSYHLLHHFPRTASEPLDERFSRFPWIDDPQGLEAWRTGTTGYPIVDAGMRELAATGWMHNRVRMVVASFLTKDLLIPWQTGAGHFREQLYDADAAINTQGWQWTAGSGADAAPYFRVFNPVLQGERFDPHGAYVREWVPELAALPDRWIHHPWDAPPFEAAAAGVVLGETYPAPIVDHAAARERALAIYGALKSGHL